MADKTLFASLRDALIPQTNTVNSENAPAYALAPKGLHHEPGAKVGSAQQQPAIASQLRAC